jgi:hypothetical protein
VPNRLRDARDGPAVSDPRTRLGDHHASGGRGRPAGGSRRSPFYRHAAESALGRGLHLRGYLARLRLCRPHRRLWATAIHPTISASGHACTTESRSGSFAPGDAAFAEATSDRVRHPRGPSTHSGHSSAASAAAILESAQGGRGVLVSDRERFWDVSQSLSQFGFYLRLEPVTC